ncbi:peroxisomal acyl-coenzyme A oxidase 1-like [Actinia tenebrosa]|uniref:Acyl-coenzyme A oxidase n=1 Tax=Actinia tenebrosa TaxID=6105 RepID=A0A6P8HK10_ACTTE|nr:peroxisomal acyl-coenzyme A oxidase 1-like [Actinia tenebrosa]
MYRKYTEGDRKGFATFTTISENQICRGFVRKYLLSLISPLTFFKGVKMNQDLARERSKASFNVEELTNLLDEGPARTARRRYLESIIINDPEFDNADNFFDSREESYERSLKRGLQFLDVQRKHNIVDPEEIEILKRSIGSALPSSLNDTMFIPAIKNIGTKEQIDKWLPLAEHNSIVGTYAQTELGHGTNVRGLETTATYDKRTQEFVMHSPSLTACKWWPGCLGHSSTHAITVARLIIDSQDHGIHFFIVPLRDMKTHKPLPGIKIGDIGPKLSLFFNGTDNGYLLLDHVRIPRENMLMGAAKVSLDGKFTEPKNSKILYGTMMYVRAAIPSDTFNLLSRAVTIAIRYSAVRRQSELKEGEGELQVIDFKTQQYRLLPALATSYAFKFAAVRVLREYYTLKNKMSVGDFSSLPEMHSITSSLKAFITGQGLKYSENCRLCCGGHGYSVFSMLPDIYMLINASCTYEGDNVVLFLQVARYLLKCVNSARSGKDLPSTVSYLNDHDNGMASNATTTEQFLDPSVQLKLYSNRSKRMITTVAEKMHAKVMNGMDPMDAWNAFSADLLQCAIAHSHYLTVLYYTDFLRTGLANVSRPIARVLKLMSDIYALHGIVENSGSFLENGVLNVKQVALIREQLNLLLEQLRPDAVPLVDAFDYSDRHLNSALGRYDGNVYQQLFDWAQRSQLNRQPVLPAYDKYLKPLLQKGKAKL